MSSMGKVVVPLASIERTELERLEKIEAEWDAVVIRSRELEEQLGKERQMAEADRLAAQAVAAEAAKKIADLEALLASTADRANAEVKELRQERVRLEKRSEDLEKRVQMLTDALNAGQERALRKERLASSAIELVGDLIEERAEQRQTIAALVPRPRQQQGGGS